jgi:ABC-2 type transport system ATP-binding protein
MLEVKNLSRSYGDFRAVDAVSFSIPHGEITGLLGHNGAGKTTIMKMLSGYLEPDAGSVSINGIDLASDPKAVQRQLGYLPENLPVYPEMTVMDYLEYAATLKGLEGRARDEAVLHAIRSTDLAAKALAPIGTLSRGYKQRVGVAQALLGRPRLLILDEPTNGLDPTQTEQMRELIRGIAKDATVILSTHIMQEVEALCDRVLIINGGKLVVDEKLERLRQTAQLTLSCDLSLARLQQVLQGLDEVTAIQVDSSQQDHSPWTSYLLQLRPGCELPALCSRISELLIAQKGKLSRIAPVERSLETLFREVSSGRSQTASTPTQEVQHAA